MCYFIILYVIYIFIFLYWIIHFTLVGMGNNKMKYDVHKERTILYIISCYYLIFGQRRNHLYRPSNNNKFIKCSPASGRTRKSSLCTHLWWTWDPNHRCPVPWLWQSYSYSWLVRLDPETRGTDKPTMRHSPLLIMPTSYIDVEQLSLSCLSK